MKEVYHWMLHSWSLISGFFFFCISLLSGQHEVKRSLCSTRLPGHAALFHHRSNGLSKPWSEVSETVSLNAYPKDTLSTPYCHWRKKRQRRVIWDAEDRSLYRDLNRDTNSVPVGPQMTTLHHATQHTKRIHTFWCLPETPSLTATLFCWILKHMVFITITFYIAFAYCYK